MVDVVVVTTAANRTPVRTLRLATPPSSFAKPGPCTAGGWVGGACLRRGRRHILYRQQQEQVKQAMMVTMKSTKMVTPTATVAPNLPQSWW